MMARVATRILARLALTAAVATVAVILSPAARIRAGRAPVAPALAATEQCFPETNGCVGERFHAYWQAHGGLAINGYPISNEFTEGLADGKDLHRPVFRARADGVPPGERATQRRAARPVRPAFLNEAR